MRSPEQHAGPSTDGIDDATKRRRVDRQRKYDSECSIFNSDNYLYSMHNCDQIRVSTVLCDLCRNIFQDILVSFI